MAELPQMPLFVDDFEAATAHLDLEEDGAYNRLLRLCWRQSSCSVPDDDDWIRRHMRVDSDKYERVIRPIIDEFFSRSGGRVFQKRQRQVREFARNMKTARQDAGRKGGLSKARKNNKTSSSNAKDLPEQNSSEALASKPYQTKKGLGLGLGLERRSLRPGGHDPPSTQPDPDKFLMSKDWSIGPGTETRLVETFGPELGVDQFWRQVERFIQHHCDEGTVDTQRGFCRSLENWLIRADANRGNGSISGHANGSVAGTNGHDPPIKRRCVGRIDQFVEAVLAICLAEKRRLYGSESLEAGEENTFKVQAQKIFEGHDVVLGVSWGPNLTADEVFARLPEFDGFAQHDPSGLPEESLAK